MKIKEIISFYPLTWDWGDKGRNCVSAELPTYAISVFLTIEIHKNCIDTSRVTDKQYNHMDVTVLFYYHMDVM